MHSRLLLVTAVTLAACSGQPDVIVTRASERTGSALTNDGSPLESTATTIAEPNEQRAVDPGDLTSLLLTGAELPGWKVASPMAVGDEPTFEATDCPLMNDVWSVAARPGERTRGHAEAIGVQFRNTAVFVDDEDEAARLMDAVSMVSESCPAFNEEHGKWWSEPIEMPSAEPGTRPSEWTSAAVVLGNTDGIRGWTIAMWQLGSTMVVLEVEGDEMWSHVDFMLEVMSDHLNGRPIPEIPNEWSDITDLQDPPAEATVETTVPIPTTSGSGGTLPPVTLPPATLPPTTEPQNPDEFPISGEFPPSGEQWSDHPLARLAPHPSDLGGGWTYERASITEAAPSSPDDEFPGCAGTAPPTMDGLDVTYRRHRPESESTWDLADEIQLMLGSGDAEAAQSTLDALRRVFDCPDAIAELEVEIAAVSTTVTTTADDFMMFTYRLGESFGMDLETLTTIGAGRYGDFMIAAAWATADSPGADSPDAQEHADDVAALIERIALSR
jgi:hypothetical protein